MLANATWKGAQKQKTQIWLCWLSNIKPKWYCLAFIGKRPPATQFTGFLWQPQPDVFFLLSLSPPQRGPSSGRNAWRKLRENQARVWETALFWPRQSCCHKNQMAGHLVGVRLKISSAVQKCGIYFNSTACHNKEQLVSITSEFIHLIIAKGHEKSHFIQI